MAPSLVSLPLEVLEMIVDMPTEGQRDLISCLRSTCREVQQKLDKFFSKAYFTVRYVYLDELKLREVCALSNVPLLATQVKTLMVIYRPAKDAKYLAFHVGDGRLTWNDFDLALQRLVNLKQIVFKDTTVHEATEDHRVGSARFQAVDISIAFATFMLAFQRRKIRLKAIHFYCYGGCSDLHCLRSVRLDDTAILLRLDSTLANLELLRIRLLPTVASPWISGDAGTKAGNDLGAALQRCPELKDLVLRCSIGAGALTAIHQLASAVSLPKLQNFTLSNSPCTVEDLMLFFTQHRATLRRCVLHTVFMGEDDPNCFRDLLEFIGERMNFSKLGLAQLGIGHFLVDFIPMYCTIAMYEFNWADNSDPEGWILVNVKRSVLLEGHQEVQSGLARMQQCLTFRQYRT
ncbi:hypothetical protein LTR10_010150 [Elasticomyces elasticus]|nr:hypothetical protein LTR10_010150 [Elasticomyces elasticus]KAK4972055.1 hypothetical protein LTR42_006560 [Elasticomyces elasticus]